MADLQLTITENYMDEEQVSSKEIDSKYVFRNLPFACVILDKNFMIVEATNIYLTYTFKDSEKVLGTYFLDHFPENPDSKAKVSSVLLKLMQKTIDTKEPQHLPTFRYDLYNPSTGNWEKRYWKSKFFPILKHNQVLYILHNIEEVTDSVLEERTIRNQG